MPPPAGLLCFDLDGTLIGSGDGSTPRFHPRLLDYLHELRNGGYAWAINSGRSLSSIIGALGQYGILIPPDFIIARESEIYRPEGMGRWADFGSWNEAARREQRKFIKSRGRVFKRLKREVTESGAEFLETDDGQVAVVTKSNARMDALCENFAAVSEDDPEFGFQRNGVHLRFTHADYSKGTALRELCRLLDITPLSVFAAGDNDNDLPMLSQEFAARLACPANAIPRVRQSVLAANGYVATAEASVGMMQALDFFYFRAG